MASQPLCNYDRHLKAPHRPQAYWSAASRARQQAERYGIQLEVYAAGAERFGDTIFVHPPASLDNPLDDPWYDCHCVGNWAEAAGRVDDYARLIEENF